MARGSIGRNGVLWLALILLGIGFSGGARAATVRFDDQGHIGLSADQLADIHLPGFNAHRGAQGWFGTGLYRSTALRHLTDVGDLGRCMLAGGVSLATFGSAGGWQVVQSQCFPHEAGTGAVAAIVEPAAAAVAGVVGGTRKRDRRGPGAKLHQFRGANSLWQDEEEETPEIGPLLLAEQGMTQGENPQGAGGLGKGGKGSKGRGPFVPLPVPTSVVPPPFIPPPIAPVPLLASAYALLTAFTLLAGLHLRRA